MIDPYCNGETCLMRLEKDYETHGSLIVAFDFDNTIYDYHNEGHTFDWTIATLKECQKEGFTLILFTSNEGEKLDKCIKYCHDLGLKDFFVNESPVNKGQRKPYYNILLDDRAGLGLALSILRRLLFDIAKRNRGKIDG